MRKIKSIWSDNSGQDLVECALMAGFVAVAALAIVPGAAKDVLGLAGFSVWPTEKATRLAAIVIAVVFLGIIILRRKSEE